jgi:MerR family transcriptional regulator, copper efflux regulator
MRIGEAAARAGVSRDTLRYYERRGLLPYASRSANGYRDYSASIVERVKIVRSALRFGFSVKQIAAFFRARDAGRPPCRDVRRAAGELAREMDRRIAELADVRAALAKTLDEWDQRLAATPAGTPARLLESLSRR